VATLETRIREVLGSDLAQDIGYPDKVFVAFIKPSRKIPG
jgi:hypothetical protein